MQDISLYQRGSIIRIKLYNFLTYSNVEVYPGPKLNIILGPNGTGKSSIVCAIALGLGGKPKVLGRADKLREFVMHTQDEGYVEIELKDGEGATRVVRRIFSSESDSSTWILDGRQCNQKEVLKMVEDMRIQINNLCTFLPQDKVGEFSTMTPVQLLEKTEEALGVDLREKHEKLIELQGEAGTSLRERDICEETLSRLQRQNDALQRDRELYEKRQDHMRKIDLLEKKMLWVEFEELRVQAMQLKSKKDEAQRRLEEMGIDTTPLEQQWHVFRNRVDVVKQKFQQDKANMQKLKKKEEACGQENENFDQAERESQHELKNLEKQARVREQKLVYAKEFCEKLIQEKKEESKKVDIAEIRNQQRELAPEIARLGEEIFKVEENMDDLKQQMRQVENMRRDKQGRLANLQSAKTRQMAKVKAMREGKDAVELYSWLDRNKALFRGRVYGPIAAEVSIENPDHAKCLEFHVKNATWCAFVVENQHDYNLLINTVKNRGNHQFSKRNGLSIQVIMINDGRLKPFNRRFSQREWQELQQKHGVECYLDETFSAPDAVRQALMDHAGVHEALLGSLRSQETERSIKSKQLLVRLTQGQDGGGRNACIFASTVENSKLVFQQYLVTVSRFSKNTSTMVRIVSDPKVLGMGEDKEGIKNLTSQIEDYTEQIRNIGLQVEEHENTHSNLQSEHGSLTRKKKELGDQVQNLRRLDQKIQSQKDKILQLQSQMSGDITEERARIVARLEQTIQSHFKSIEANQEIQEQLLKAEVAQTARRISFNILRDNEQAAKAALNDARRSNVELEEEVKFAKEEFKRMKTKAKVLRDKAERAADVGRDEELKAALNSLPNEPNEIEDLINEHRAEADLISDNPEVMQRYQQNLEDIEKQERKLQELMLANRHKEDSMNHISTEWEQSLLNCVQKLNSTFSTYMKQMACSGKVELYKGGGSYKDYAIHIKVKFRDHADFQVLNGKVHSGGERSVSTILYLMSLQDLMFSPFRVVDEINQGMDERNERLVFSRIVRNCCGPRRPQYFLITPKLLQGLVAMDNPDVTCHIILNGPWNLPDPQKWLEVVSKVKKEAKNKRRRTG